MSQLPVMTPFSKYKSEVRCHNSQLWHLSQKNKSKVRWHNSQLWHLSPKNKSKVRCHNCQLWHLTWPSLSANRFLTARQRLFYKISELQTTKAITEFDNFHIPMLSCTYNKENEQNIRIKKVTKSATHLLFLRDKCVFYCIFQRSIFNTKREKSIKNFSKNFFLPRPFVFFVKKTDLFGARSLVFRVPNLFPDP